MRNLQTAAIIALVSVCSLILLSGCAASHQSQVSFPDSDDLFVTTGDGDITKPYTPVGQLVHIANGYRLPLPLIGLIPIQDVDPDLTLRQEIMEEARRMGGDGVINVQLDWQPPSNGFLGIGASGGHLIVYGTVIRR